MGDYDKLSDDEQKKIINQVKQEYLAYLFLNNSNAKLHTQLKKDVANDYSKGSTDAYPTDIHKALTLMTEYKPLKLDAPTLPAQGTAFVTGGKNNNKKGGDKGAESKEYIKASKWNELSPKAKTKIIEARKKSKARNDDNKSVALVKSLSKTIKSLEKSNRKLKVRFRSVRKMMIPIHYYPQKRQAISRRVWRCLRSATPRLFWPLSQGSSRT